MAKKNTAPVVTEVKDDDFSTWTREQLAERYDANVAERKRLAAENAQLKVFYSAAASSKKEAKVAAKLAKVQEQLEALKGKVAELPSEEEVLAEVNAGNEGINNELAM